VKIGCILIVAVCGLIPGESFVTDSVDVIEFNHYYNDGKVDVHLDKAKEIFQQVIAYNWNGYRFEIVDWAIVRKQNSVEGDGFVLIRHDGIIRKIIYRIKIVSHTQYDVEEKARGVIPKSQRKGFKKIRALQGQFTP